MYVGLGSTVLPACNVTCPAFQLSDDLAMGSLADWLQTLIQGFSSHHGAQLTESFRINEPTRTPTPWKGWPVYFGAKLDYPQITGAGST